MITILMHHNIINVVFHGTCCFCDTCQKKNTFCQCGWMSFPLRYFTSYAWVLRSKSHKNTYKHLSYSHCLLFSLQHSVLSYTVFSRGIAASKAWKQRFPGLHCSHYCSLLLVAEQKQTQRLRSHWQSWIQNLEINTKLHDFENVKYSNDMTSNKKYSR